MNRRDFFKKTLHAAGAVAVLPLVSPSTIMTALQPIIEYAKPMDGFPDLTLAKVVERSIQACDRNETHWPGFTRALHKALEVKIWGINLPPSSPPSTVQPSLEQLTQSWVQWLESEDHRTPGLLRSIYDSLTPRMVGLSVPDFYRALWRTDATVPMDGWTHHAWAVSEAGKP